MILTLVISIFVNGDKRQFLVLSSESLNYDVFKKFLSPEKVTYKDDDVSINDVFRL